MSKTYAAGFIDALALTAVTILLLLAALLSAGCASRLGTSASALAVDAAEHDNARDGATSADQDGAQPATRGAYTGHIVLRVRVVDLEEAP